MPMLTEMPLSALLEAFSSSAPTPGGGSAAAISGAIGASLFAMVAGLPRSRTDAPEERAALVEVRGRLVALQGRLAALADRDADAYDLVVAAYRRPKTTDTEKSARTVAIQAALGEATAVPIETMRACADGLVAGLTVAEHGNRSAMSDVATAMQLLATGLQAALFNVETNLGGLKDAGVAAAISEDVRGISGRGTAALEALYSAAGVSDLLNAAARRIA